MTSAEDTEYAGHPSTARTDEYVAEVHELLLRKQASHHPSFDLNRVNTRQTTAKFVPRAG